MAIKFQANPFKLEPTTMLVDLPDVIFLLLPSNVIFQDYHW